MNPAGQPAGQLAQPRAVGSGRLWAELWEGQGDIIYIYIYIFTINVYILTHVIRPKTTVLVTNRAPVARFGPKLSQNGSYGLQEPFQTPPGPP